jgi:hypothetical protein
MIQYFPLLSFFLLRLSCRVDKQAGPFRGRFGLFGIAVLGFSRLIILLKLFPNYLFYASLNLVKRFIGISQILIISNPNKMNSIIL